MNYKETGKDLDRIMRGKEMDREIAVSKAAVAQFKEFPTAGPWALGAKCSSTPSAYS
jgi:hypothetical protein